MKKRKFIVQRIITQAIPVMLPVFLLFSSYTESGAQFKEESARMAYELRMNGDILYAAAMLEKLMQQGKHENGLVQYEMSRLREHQSLGGAQWIKPETIIDLTRWAVEMDPDNLAFVVQDANCRFDRAYMSMMTESETAKKDVGDCVEKLEEVLAMDPDFHEVRVKLVEIYANLPEEMGGDREKAGKYATYLEGKDPWFGMLARDAMLSDSLSRVDFWKEQLKANKKDTRVSVKLGMAYLLEEKIDDATPLLEAAVKEDPEYNVLLAQLGRYHMYQAMWHREKGEEELPKIEEAFQRYLDATPSPPVYMQAWVKGHLSNIKRFSGDQEGAERLKREATALDPSFSRASGMPGRDIYVPPGNLYRSGDYVSFMRPF